MRLWRYEMYAEDFNKQFAHWIDRLRRSKYKRTSFGLTCFFIFFWFALGCELGIYLELSKTCSPEASLDENQFSIGNAESNPELKPELALEAHDASSLQMRGDEGRQFAYLPNTSDAFDGLAATFHDNKQVCALFLYKAGKLRAARGWNERGEPSATLVDNGRGFVMELDDQDVGYIYDEGFEIAFQGRTDSGKLYRESFADGTHVLYYPNGNVRKKTRYRNEEVDGLHQTWNVSGQLIREIRNRDAERIGTDREWHDNGRIKKVLRLKNGKPHGSFVRYDEFGRTLAEGSFLNGKRTGVWSYYYASGQTKYSGSYENGKRTGWHILKSEDGKIIIRLLYHKGYLAF